MLKISELLKGSKTDLHKDVKRVSQQSEKSEIHVKNIFRYVYLKYHYKVGYKQQ